MGARVIPHTRQSRSGSATFQQWSDDQVDNPHENAPQSPLAPPGQAAMMTAPLRFGVCILVGDTGLAMQAHGFVEPTPDRMRTTYQDSACVALPANLGAKLGHAWRCSERIARAPKLEDACMEAAAERRRD